MYRKGNPAHEVSIRAPSGEDATLPNRVEYMPNAVSIRAPSGEDATKLAAKK